MIPVRRVRAWIPPVLWAGVIFALSSIPSLESGLRPVWDLVLRKIAHAAEFAILAALLLRALAPQTKRAVPVAFFLALFYAASDEWHQTFVENRTGAWADALIDAIGIIVGLAVYASRTKNRG